MEFPPARTCPLRMCIALVPVVAIGLTGFTALSARSAGDAWAGSVQQGRGSRIAFTRLVGL